MFTKHAVNTPFPSDTNMATETTTKHKMFRRRKKLIKPKHQLKLALIVVTLLIFYTFILGSGIFYPVAVELYAPNTDQVRIPFAILGLLKTFWPYLLVVFVLLFIITILFSHRGAGPIYRLKMAAKDFVKGNFNQIRLRKTDEFREIETSVNAVAQYLEGVKSLDSNFRSHIKEKLTQISNMLDKGNQNDTNDIKDLLDELITEIDSKPDAFSAYGQSK